MSLRIKPSINSGRCASRNRRMASCTTLSRLLNHPCSMRASICRSKRSGIFASTVFMAFIFSGYTKMFSHRGTHRANARASDRDRVWRIVEDLDGDPAAVAGVPQRLEDRDEIGGPEARAAAIDIVGVEMAGVF